MKWACKNIKICFTKFKLNPNFDYNLLVEGNNSFHTILKK
jgi:hypothetical protein